jgi:hypothetical protein
VSSAAVGVVPFRKASLTAKNAENAKRDLSETKIKSYFAFLAFLAFFAVGGASSQGHGFSMAAGG